MLGLGSAKKVSIHINEDTSSYNDFLFKEIVSFLLESGISGATVLRPQAGFGSHHRTHVSNRPGVEGRHLPVRIEFIETPTIVDALMPQLCDLVTDGLIDVQDTIVVRVATGKERV